MGFAEIHNYIVERAPLAMLLAAIAFWIVIVGMEYYAIWKRSQKQFEMDSTLIIREMVRKSKCDCGILFGCKPCSEKFDRLDSRIRSGK